VCGSVTIWGPNPEINLKEKKGAQGQTGAGTEGEEERKKTKKGECGFVTKKIIIVQYYAIETRT